jgi:hypothetical protein
MQTKNSTAAVGMGSSEGRKPSTFGGTRPAKASHARANAVGFVRAAAHTAAHDKVRGF